ncbi:MAG: hypothetical protein J7551_00190 [Chloroflexi bacterium]|nr:hypothetical protein [Chloroflexota bacterium]
MRRSSRRQLPDAETLRLACSARLHQRFVQLRVATPLVLSGALIAIVPSVLVLALSAERFSAVAAFLALLITAPAALLCLLPYALLIVLLYGTRRAYKGARHTLERLHRAVRRANLTVQRLSERAAKPVIALNARYAAFERLISAPFRAIRISEDENSRP